MTQDSGSGSRAATLAGLGLAGVGLGGVTLLAVLVASATTSARESLVPQSDNG